MKKLSAEENKPAELALVTNNSSQSIPEADEEIDIDDIPVMPVHVKKGQVVQNSQTNIMQNYGQAGIPILNTTNQPINTLSPHNPPTNPFP